MPSYRFRASDRKGEVYAGTIESVSQADAAAALLRLGLKPVGLRKATVIDPIRRATASFPNPPAVIAVIALLSLVVILLVLFVEHPCLFMSVGGVVLLLSIIANMDPAIPEKGPTPVTAPPEPRPEAKAYPEPPPKIIIEQPAAPQLWTVRAEPVPPVVPAPVVAPASAAQSAQPSGELAPWPMAAQWAQEESSRAPHTPIMAVELSLRMKELRISEITVDKQRVERGTVQRIPGMIDPAMCPSDQIAEMVSALRTEMGLNGIMRREALLRVPEALLTLRAFRLTAAASASSLKDAAARLMPATPEELELDYRSWNVSGAHVAVVVAARAKEVLTLVRLAEGAGFKVKGFLIERDVPGSQPPQVLPLNNSVAGAEFIVVEDRE